MPLKADQSMANKLLVHFAPNKLHKTSYQIPKLLLLVSNSIIRKNRQTQTQISTDMTLPQCTFAKKILKSV